MTYKEYIPCDALRQYVKCYYLYESDTDTVFEDSAFATGCIEIMFNLGTGSWQTGGGDGFATTPPVELWGQIIRPLIFKSFGKNTMLGIRFYPHGASVFLNEDLSLFNNHVTNLIDVAGKDVHTLHARLLDTLSADRRMELVEAFLLNKLSLSGKRFEKLTLVGHVIKELRQDDFFDNIENVAARYGITSRYLQKLFLLHTGLTPKLYAKINRFQNSLLLVAKGSTSLTDIAYECGYFDQSHFIREFRSFTGFAPSAFSAGNSSAVLASPNK